MANVKGTSSTTRGKSQKGHAAGQSAPGGGVGSPSRATKDPGRKRTGTPPVHPLNLAGATNMQKPGSDNMSHHPNGEHHATNSKMKPC